MRLATCRINGVRTVGTVSDDASTFTPFAVSPGEAERGVLGLIEALAHGAPLPAVAGAPVALASVMLEAPLPLPRRNLFCVGRNYRAHAKELSGSVFKASASDAEAWPIVFTKVPECVVGPHDDVQLPGESISSQIDYEAELAVVIGRGGRNISRAEALSHVFGYTIINDVTARELQKLHRQWFLGKSLDGFCPMGPYLVTADELDAANLDVKCWVNGELRQNANSAQLIFDIPTLIETISAGIELQPGDLIATGTPAGVGIGFAPPRFLRAGDVVKIEIQGLGVLENPVG